MSFQESADSLKAKLHISPVKTPVLIGICVVGLIVVLSMFVNAWNLFSNDSFNVIKKESSQDDSSDFSDSPHKGLAEDEETQKEKSRVVLHVSGEVVNPGVYELYEGARICDAIEAAGGFTPEADQNLLNLARLVHDGEQIAVLSVSEAETLPSTPLEPSPQAKININKASSDELCSLPGIGASTAAKIIADRESKGPFGSPEELMRVSGIGQKKYDQIASLICI